MIHTSPIFSGSISMSGSFTVNGNDLSQGVAAGSVDSSKLADGSVGSGKLAAEFTATSSLSPAASIDVNFSSAQVFKLTMGQNTVLNITNPVVGSTKLFVLTGAGSTYSSSFQVGGADGTFNRIAGLYDDTSGVKNFYQVSCVAPEEFWYSISQID